MKPGDLTALQTILVEPRAHFDYEFLQPIARVGWRIRFGEPCLILQIQADWAGIEWAQVFCSHGAGWIETSNLSVICPISEIR